MPADPRLDSVLRALLKPYTPDSRASDATRIYASAAAVLSTLTNPLNVTLLTTQILISPAIWNGPDGLRAGLRTFGAFQAATLGKIEGRDQTIGVEEWINAVVRGANNNVPRWKHLLLLGGILSVFEKNSFLPRVTRRSLEDAFVRAVNLSLESNKNKELESDVLSLILSHAIDGLSYHAKSQINCDALVPIVMRSIYYSKEGFQSGYFLSTIDNDVVIKQGKLAWPAKSNSLLELQERLARPLLTSMSSVARLAGYGIKGSRDPRTIHMFLDKLMEFSNTLTTQWRMNRLSEVSMLDEEHLLDPDSRKQTIPVVWQILKMVLFTTTLILQDLIMRILQAPVLTDEVNGPEITAKTLRVLRGFYFITARLGNNAFISYNFVYTTAIDILTSYPAHAEKFIISIAPPSAGTVPPILMDRILDLYFLNTSENFTPVLSPLTIQSYLLTATQPYLLLPLDTATNTINKNLHPLFESAHSVMLAIIASPAAAALVPSPSSPGGGSSQNTLASTILPFYIDAVFKTFPGALQSRQFRLAMSTLVKETSPPSAISNLSDDSTTRNLPDIIMQILYDKVVAEAASSPSSSLNPAPSNLISTSPSPPRTPNPAVPTAITSGTPPTIETYIFALVDSLPHMSPPAMSRWLDPITELVNKYVSDSIVKVRCRDRLWEVLSGETFERGNVSGAGGGSEEVQVVQGHGQGGPDSRLAVTAAVSEGGSGNSGNGGTAGTEGSPSMDSSPEGGMMRSKL